MRLPKRDLLALAFTVFGLPAWALPTYDCSLRIISGAEWVPHRLSVSFSEDFSSAEITDAAFGVAVPARVARRSESTFSLSWSLPGLAVLTEAGQAEPRFRAVLNTANKKMSVHSTRRTAAGPLPRASGSCELVHSLSLLVRHGTEWH